MTVKPKKRLGQHFLKDPNICQKIVGLYSNFSSTNNVLELGPGTGALTQFLIAKKELQLQFIEVDEESVTFLQDKFPAIKGKIHAIDFLQADLSPFFNGENFAVIGNFPYNISSQILFHCLTYKNQVPEIIGMFQKEVAERITEKPGSKKYGILSVLLQTYYDVAYCFTVSEKVFDPPPKVKSGVIRCLRNQREKLPVEEELYKKVVKTAFGQRRKTIKNALKANFDVEVLPTEDTILKRRAETLSVEEFIELTLKIDQNSKK